LLTHDIGLYSAYPTRNRWNFRRDDEAITIELPAKIRSNSAHLLHDFALTGGGISCLPTLVCGDYLANGTLISILVQYELCPPLELLTICPTTRGRAVKVKLLIDFITRRFSGEPEWDRVWRSNAHSA
jgi:DNA-binding transcriptional LysR family regulator